MSAEIIEGTAVEVYREPEVRAVAVVQQPGQTLIARDHPSGPAEMVAVASNLATVLKDIVERQKLYTVIQGKMYPQVEAWLTIGRLDNVVAREPRPPIRHDDGSYEAFAELVRLSDGMVIGSSSALCGTPDDKPWGGRAEPARRSMAQTRATSRAFRQQYSWIMALAGYEPTPAEEMPNDPAPRASAGPSSPAEATAAPTTGSWSGAVTLGAPPVDGSLRQSPDGPAFGFVVLEPREGRTPLKLQVIALGPLADALAVVWDNPEQASVDGEMSLIPWKKDGVDKTPYRRVIATRIATPEWTLPAADAPVRPPEPTSVEKVENLSELPW